MPAVYTHYPELQLIELAYKYGKLCLLACLLVSITSGVYFHMKVPRDLVKYIAGVCFHLFFWCIALNPSFQDWLCPFCLCVLFARWATILQLLLTMPIPDMVGPFGRRLKSPASSVANTSQSCRLVSLGHWLSLLWPAILGGHSQLIKLTANIIMFAPQPSTKSVCLQLFAN